MSTFTPTKYGNKTISIDSDDKDPITPVREKIAKEIRPKGRLPNLDNVTAAIQKLLDVISTLMKHCKPAIEHGGQKLSCNTIVTRRDFDSVQAKGGCNKSGEHFVVFKSFPAYEEEEFDITSLIKLPPELDGILCTKTYKSGLIKYDSLFEMSYVLHDTVLIPFLANLKNHLLSVKSCLTDIHEWLHKTPTNLFFIERAFGIGTVQRAEHSAKVNPLCANCGCRYSQHDTASCSRKICCPGHSGWPFKRSYALVLKWFFIDTKINETFDVSNQNQRSRLLKLIEYLSHE